MAGYTVEGRNPSLLQDTSLGEGSDLLVRHVEDLLTDLNRVLAEERRRMTELPGCLGQPELRALHRMTPHLGVVHEDEVAAMAQLWIIEEVLSRLHNASWDTRLLEGPHQLTGLPALRPLADQAVQRFLVGLAPEQGGEALLLRPVGSAHRLAQGIPFGIGLAGNRTPAILASTGISPMRGGRRMAIPHAVAFLPIEGVIEQ